MTSLVASATINALAFSAGSWLFSKLSHSGYLEEQERHNRALEELTRTREKSLEQETARKDHLAKLKGELVEANQDEALTARALNVLGEFKKANPLFASHFFRTFTPQVTKQKSITLSQWSF